MIKKVAKKNKLPVIDLHSAMDGMPELFPDFLLINPPHLLCFYKCGSY